MKFFNLFKKEIAELVNAHTIVSLVIIFAMFMVLGNVMSNTMEEAIKQEYVINISDKDGTEFTESLIERFRENGAEVNEYTTTSEDYYEILEGSEKDSMIILPAGFTESVENGEPPEIISVSKVASAAMISNLTNNNDGAVSFMQICISETFAQMSGISPENMSIITSPVSVSEYTVVDGKEANISPVSVVSQLSTKSMILPIIVFMLILMTSQTLMSAISNEKIDKTLETLLSAPVSRLSILSAKMLAAATVAILQAAVFTVGVSFFMDDAMNTAKEEVESTLAGQLMPVEEALEKLGLTLGAPQYLLIGLQLFFTIMICLSLSLMLGALVTDTKQSQTMIMPLMVMTMVPYMVSLFADINTLPTVLKFIIYAIPFTHTFSSMSNLMFGHMALYWGGLAYQAVIFAACMFFAVRLFKSDMILTASLNFGKKSKFKKQDTKDE